jgi:hypothetical protein
LISRRWRLAAVVAVAGHMVYLDPANRQRLKRDFTSLVEQTR